MNPSKQQILWGAAGILFALASLKIHHEVKVEMEHRGLAASDRIGDLRVGSEAPDFSATDLKGRPVVLSELRGRKAVVVDFWATWCAPCLESMPALQQVQEEFKERQVEIVAVNLGEDPGTVRGFVERHQYTFRVVADEDRAIGSRFGVAAIPAQVVVDANGLLAWVQVGYDSGKEGELRQLLEKLAQ
ncbi:MAG: TlpA disulfide reductase family protein [Bryobacterales bacterium]|nr:TlpA disulfide reductase family protein [Bryobacterales bacterium]